MQKELAWSDIHLTSYGWNTILKFYVHTLYISLYMFFSVLISLIQLIETRLIKTWIYFYSHD